MNLLGNNSYKKYISIVSGMILLLIVVSPFLKLLKLDGIMDYYLNSNIYQADVDDFQKELRVMEKKQKNEVLLDFKNRISKQIADILAEDGIYLYDVEVAMNQDVESNNFGEIDSMEIKAGYLEDEGVTTANISVDKIIISTTNSDNINEENRTANLPSPQEIYIKNRLSDFYNIEQDNINISIQGG
jgi:stage III sporulation protein AF